MVRVCSNGSARKEDGMSASDFCTKKGASDLKERIEDYWRGQGYEVDVKLVDAGFQAAMRSARTDVRSDMVNGLPIRRLKEEPLVYAR